MCLNKNTFFSVVIALTLISGIAQGAPLSSQVHTFYYPWYKNLESDGEWSHWNHAVSVRDGKPFSHKPPEQIGANFYPSIGLYSSTSREDMVKHMKQCHKAGVGVLATSWWGVNDITNRVLPLLFDVAEEHNIKIAFHLEPIAGRKNAKAQVYRDAIVYLLDQYGEHPALYRDKARNNRPMFYMYDSYLVQPADWASIFGKDGTNTLRDTTYDALFIGLFLMRTTAEKTIVDAKFDGFYTYFASDGFTHGSTPKNWPAMNTFAKENNLLFIPSVAPGYDDTRIRPWNTVNQRERDAGAYYDGMWKEAVSLKVPYISITSFNEWHEGTQIAPATPKVTDTYTYLDYKPRAEDYYLTQTATWVKRYQNRLKQK